MRVLLEAGHYPNRGGAPGEAQWTKRLADALAAQLGARGVEAVIVGSWYPGGNPPPAVRATYPLYLSLHYDAAIYGAGRNTGCLAGRATRDPRGADADRFIALWEAEYPEATGIPLRRERLNLNITDYYGFRDTDASTPGVLVEHGCGAPVGTGGYPPGDDAPLLLEQLDLVAEADARAICAFLGVPWHAAPEPPAEPGEEPEDVGVIEEQQKQIDALRQEVAGLNSQVGYYQHDVEAPLRQEVADLKAALQEAQGKQAELDRLMADVTRLQDLASELSDQLERLGTPRLVTRVELEFSDGAVQDVPVPPIAQPQEVTP